MSNAPHISQTDQNPFALIKQKQTSQPSTLIQPTNPRSLSGWIQLYYLLVVQAQALKTKLAKQQDLRKFLTFYREFTQSDDIYRWINPVTKAFQEHLLQSHPPLSNQPYRATTINRVLATIKHFACWLVARYALPDGNPTVAIKDIVIDEPDWKGLTQEQITALKKSCQDRLAQDQSNRKRSKLETAVFYCLLYTGLRETELVNLNRNQYHDGGFHQVKRKNNRITRFVPLPSEATTVLNEYLNDHQTNEGPLFISIRKKRLSVRNIGYICERLAKHAKQHLNSAQSFHFSPHQLRHTFLKNITDRYGLNYAQRMSGNTSIKEIFRYAKPSQAEINQCVNNLFG